MDEKRGSRRVKNVVSIYYKIIDEKSVDSVKDEIYHTIDPEDSFSFFMSLNKLDSSFSNLNKAFVLMMKQMDAKLNYIIDILRDGRNLNELNDFEHTYSCDISSGGVSILSSKEYDVGNKVFLKIFLPIAAHYTINVLGDIVGKDRKNDRYCYNIEFIDINNQSRELIIHYMIFVERKMARDRLKDE